MRAGPGMWPRAVLAVSPPPASTLFRARKGFPTKSFWQLPTSAHPSNGVSGTGLFSQTVTFDSSPFPQYVSFSIPLKDETSLDSIFSTVSRRLPATGAHFRAASRRWQNCLVFDGAEVLPVVLGRRISGLRKVARWWALLFCGDLFLSSTLLSFFHRLPFPRPSC